MVNKRCVGEIAALKQQVQRVIADRQAAVRPMSGLPVSSAWVAQPGSGKRMVPTR